MKDEAIEIVVARLEAGPDAVRASEALLSAEERRRAARFKLDRERRRYTVARARLRRLLGERLGVRPGEIALRYGKRGKPALDRPFADSGLRFNVSHCGDVAVFAFAAGREIGVDVEAVREIPDADEMARLVFSRREHVSYFALDRRDRARGFFNCWTRKEAFIKAQGDGLFCPLDSFDVSLAPGEPARILRVGKTPGHLCGWKLRSFAPGPGLIGAVAFGWNSAGHRAEPRDDWIVVRRLARRDVAEGRQES